MYIIMFHDCAESWLHTVTAGTLTEAIDEAEHHGEHGMFCTTSEWTVHDVAGTQVEEVAWGRWDRDLQAYHVSLTQKRVDMIRYIILFENDSKDSHLVPESFRTLSAAKDYAYERAGWSYITIIMVTHAEAMAVTKGTYDRGEGYLWRTL